MENSCHTIREQRNNFDGSIYLLTPFAPWTLSLKLDAVNISKTGLCTVLNLEAFNKSITVNDLNSILCINDPFQLQIESKLEHLNSPTILSRLVRKNIYGQKLELAFSFDEISDEIIDLTLEFGTIFDI